MASFSRKLATFLATGSIFAACSCDAIDLPNWAYPIPPSGFKLPADDGTIRRVPDSKVGYTLSQVRDRFMAPDWHPQDHPKMPEVVARGRAPNVLACGFCHRANGPGGPENASIAGLPYAYIVQQMNEYKSGVRSSALPARIPQSLMISTSKAVTDEDVREAATYFSALKPRRNIRVVESAMVPKTQSGNWIMEKSASNETEAIGLRIIELPEDVEQFDSRDSRANFVAYVPAGSVNKGEAIVAGKVPEKTPACATCHGATLRGIDAIPSIAGRSPTYVVRQLYELQAGIRNGQAAPPMKAAIEKLSHDDMIDVAAYLATLPP